MYEFIYTDILKIKNHIYGIQIFQENFENTLQKDAKSMDFCITNHKIVKIFACGALNILYFQDNDHFLDFVLKIIYTCKSEKKTLE